MAISKTLLLKGIGGVAAAGTVTIGSLGAAYPNEFKDLFKSVDQIEKEKKEKVENVNGKLNSLGLGENDCRLATSDFKNSNDYSKDCVLDETKFKKIKFFDGDDSAEPTVEGLSGKSVTLNISNKHGGEIKFLFKNVEESLVITKTQSVQNGKITIKKERETEFEEKNNKLSKVVDPQLKAKLEKVNGKLGALSLPGDCRFDSTEKDESLECALDETKLKAIKFSNKKENEELKVSGDVSSNLKIKVEIKDREDDAVFSFTGLTHDLTILGDISKGKIVIRNEEKTFRLVDDKLTKGNPNEALKKLNERLGKMNIPLGCRFDESESEKSLECDVSETELKKIKFSNKGDGDLTVKGNVPSDLKLKVDKNDQNEMTFTFTGSSSDIKLFGDKTKGKIVLKSDKKFKEKEEKLEKESSGSNDDLRTKLKEFNEQLGKVNAPVECRFDEAESETAVECGVNKDELKAMKFSKDNGALNYTAGENFAGMKLALRVFDEVDARGEKKKSMILTFKEFNTTVKLSGGEKTVSFINGTNPEFEIYEDEDDSEDFVVGFLWDINYLEKTLILGECTIGKGQSKGECTFDPIIKSVNVKKTSENNFSTLTVNDTTSNKFELYKDIENFNQGYKFVYKGTKISSKDGSPACLENNGEYEFKWRFQEIGKVGYLTKKNG